MLDIIQTIGVQWRQWQASSALPRQLGHFDKMMVMRVLSRLYMQAGQVPNAIAWLAKTLQGVEEGAANVEEQQV